MAVLTGSAVVASSATRWAARAAWSKATGRDPRIVEGDDTDWREALAWTAASAAAVSAARMLAKRGAYRGWQALAGAPPPA